MKYSRATFLISAIVLAIYPSAIAQAAEKRLLPKVLVDFKDARAVQWKPAEAEAVAVAQGGSHALQVTTEAASSYPSVSMVPQAGAWDVSGYEAVQMEVTNPQDSEVRVLLCINNPNSDGVHHCNVESATIQAHGSGKVTVPFGMWHGNAGHDLDLKNIVSVQVLLDKPGKSHRFLVHAIRAVQLTADMSAVAADPFFKQMRAAYGRGVNLGNALDAPKEGDWGVRLKEEYFTAIKEAGFDSVRIPIRWSTHAAASAPFKIDAAFFARVDWAVNQSLQRRLIPIVNVHHYDELFQSPDAHRTRFLALWQQIAEHYRSFPPALVFELLNEPHDKLTSTKWNPMLAEAIRVVRKTNPTRDIVVGPVSWNSIKELANLELPEKDRHLVATVHYYDPFHFTHQGAGFAGPEAQSWLGTKWTGSDAERKAIARDLDAAIAWAVEHRRPIYLGEFGSFNRGDMESRARWTRCMAESALERKMSFAYWEFCSGFGIYDPQTNAWHAPLKDALLGTAK